MIASQRAAHRYIIACLTRFVARHGHRLVQADGRLSDLFVSLAEARSVLVERTMPAPRLAEAAGWPSVEEAEPGVAAALATLLPAIDGSPLGRLAARFALEPLDLRLLIAAAAPHESVDLARLYSFAQADFTTRQPTVGLLVELVAEAHEEGAMLAARFDETAPLVRHRLVRLGEAAGWSGPPPRLHRALSVPPRVVDWLSGRSPPLPQALAPACRFDAVGVSPQPADQAANPAASLVIDPGAAAEIHALIADLVAGEPMPQRLLLLGLRGAGRRTLLAGLLAMRRRSLLTVDVARLPTDDPVDHHLAELAREALHLDAALLLRLDGCSSEPGPAQRLAVLLAERWSSHPDVLALASAEPVAVLDDLSASFAELRLPLPAASEQRRAWERALGRAEEGDPALAELLAERFQLTPGRIDRAVVEARRRAAATRSTAPLSLPELAHAVRRQADHVLATIAEPFPTTLTWDDVVLPDEVMSTLADVVNHARFRSQVFDGWGFRHKMAYGRGLSCLFSGPPGTGKTMVAAVLADSLGRELYRIDLSRVTSKWVGETEKNLARVFDEAERAQVVLLFDEADSLFSTRTDVKSANDRFANMEVNYLLQRMESYEGMTILTTNFDTSIDEAFKRRIKFRIAFPMPDAAQRTALFRSMVPAAAPLAAEVDFTALGERHELSGGGIKNAVLRAAFYAAEEGGQITFEHLRRAAVAEAEEMGRLVASRG